MGLRKDGVFMTFNNQEQVLDFLEMVQMDSVGISQLSFFFSPLFSFVGKMGKWNKWDKRGSEGNFEALARDL